jgi:hypothetical protein
MSAPSAPDWVVFSCVQLPRETPPVVPVVQRVIGPPEVENSLGDVEALEPAAEEILPADFTKSPPVPALTFASKPTVELPTIDTLPADPAVRVPVPVYAPVSAISTEPFAETFLSNVTRPPVVSMSTYPPVELMVALLAVVISPDPRRTTLLVACIAPVRAMVVPPEILSAPAAVSAPAPEYPALGLIVMFPAPVVF